MAIKARMKKIITHKKYRYAAIGVVAILFVAVAAFAAVGFYRPQGSKVVDAQTVANTVTVGINVYGQSVQMDASPNYEQWSNPIAVPNGGSGSHEIYINNSAFNVDFRVGIILLLYDGALDAIHQLHLLYGVNHVAEAIKDRLGRDDFNGTACIGAPLDLRVIEKYKEAGFSTISFNTEVWGKEWFNVINPVKVTACGGFDNWIKAIEYAVKVFGPGKVRSNFVVGLQPKELTFQGIDYLASIGVVTVASSFIPMIASPLEGHRSPTVDWHWDAQIKHAQILRKYGRTYEEIYNATPARSLTHDIYQVEDETWHSFAELEAESLLT